MADNKRLIREGNKLYTFTPGPLPSMTVAPVDQPTPTPSPFPPPLFLDRPATAKVIGPTNGSAEKDFPSRDRWKRVSR
jgi:hypothetical protein